MALAPSELTLTSAYRPGSQAVGLLRCHVTAALEHLGTARPSGSRIHSARKNLKRARAMLRLIRQSIEPRHYDEADAALRGAARLLNDVRDTDVLLRAFARLRSTLKNSTVPTSLDPLRKLLQEQRRRAVASTSQQRLKAIKAVLMCCKEQTYAWPVANGMDLMAAGMQRTYRKGRRYYRAACEAGSDERLHAWRRQVKYSAYQLEAVRSMSAGKMTRRLRACTKVSDLLGRDHDLAMLQERAAATDLDAVSALQVANAIRGERQKLQRRALRIGERLYRGKVRTFEPLRRH